MCWLCTFSSIAEFVDDGERDVGADSNHFYHVVVFVTHHTDAIHLVEVEERGRGRGGEGRRGGGGRRGGKWERRRREEGEERKEERREAKVRSREGSLVIMHFYLHLFPLPSSHPSPPPLTPPHTHTHTLIILSPDKMPALSAELPWETLSTKTGISLERVKPNPSLSLFTTTVRSCQTRPGRGRRCRDGG